MTANDFRALVSVGDTICLVSDGERITGLVLQVLDDTVVLKRTDNGIRHAASINSIETFEFSSDAAALPAASVSEGTVVPSAPAAQKAGDPDVPYLPPAPGARIGKMIIFMPRESGRRTYGFIRSQVRKGAKNIFFRLSQVEDEALRTELSCAKLLRKHWQVSFTAVPQPDGQVCADHIRLVREDAALLDQLPIPFVKQGTLLSQNSFQAADGTAWRLNGPSITDDYLRLYLQEEEEFKQLPVRFMPGAEDANTACAVWLPPAAHNRLAARYSDKAQKDRISVKWTVSALNSPDPIRLEPYTPLEPASMEKKPGRPKAKSAPAKEAKAAPAAPPAVSAPKPKARKITTMEEERAELEGLLAQAEQYFAGLELPGASPEDDVYQLGVDAKQKKELKRAEGYLYKAIVSGCRPEEAVAALIPIYRRGKDREEGKVLVARGLFILEKYRNLYTAEKYSAHRISLLEKGGFNMLLVEALHAAIPSMLRPSTRMHYCSRAGHILLSQGQYEQAAQYFEQWETIRQDNATVLGIADGQDGKFAVAQKDVEQCLAVCYNMLGHNERARELAEKLLRDDKNDAVATQIIAGTLAPDTWAVQKAGLSDEDDYGYIDEDEIEPPPYARYCLENAKMQQVRQDVIKLSGSIAGNEYKGTPAQAEKDVAELSKSEFMNLLTSAQRKDYWAMTAQIVAQTMQAYRGDKKALKDNWLIPSRLWEKIAHSMLSEADDIAQRSGGVLDSARFLYMESIPLFLEKNSDRRGAFMRMVGTVLLSREELRKLTVQNSGASTRFSEWLSACRDPAAARDLLLCSFLLDEEFCYNTVRKGGGQPGRIRKGNNMHDLREGIYGNMLLRAEAEAAFDKLAVVGSEQPDERDAFMENWRRAKEIYLQKRGELTECIHRSVEDIGRPQKLREDMEQIERLRQMDMLFATDNDRLKEFCSVILDPLVRLENKDSFEQKSDDYKNVRLACERMIRSIYAAPTKLGFDELLNALESIAGSVDNALDGLYLASAPALSLKLTANEAYVDEEDPLPKIEVEIKNKINLQPAILKKLEVIVLGDRGGTAVPQGKLKAEVRGGEQASQEWCIALQPEQLEDRYFDIEVELTYTYNSKAGQEETGVSRAKFNISLADASEFEEIINYYEAISEGNGVDDSMFCGRDEYIRNLVASLRMSTGNMLCNRGIVMYGQKRAGKTSILKHLAAKIVEVYGPDTYIIVDIGSVGNYSGNLTSFFGGILGGFKRELQYRYPELYRQLTERGIDFVTDGFNVDTTSPAQAQALFRQVFQSIDRALRELGGTQKYIPMFLLDEFTYFYEWIVSGQVDPNFMLFWKAFHQDYRICTISVAMDSMPEFVDYKPVHAAGSFTNSFGCLQLQQVGYLDREATEELANRATRLSDGRSRFQDDALDYLYELTAGSAYLVVIICNHLVDYVNDNRTVRISRTVIDLVLENRMFRTGAVKADKFDPQIGDPGVFGAENAAVAKDNLEILACIALQCDSEGHELRRSELLADCLERLTSREDKWLDYLLARLVRRDVLECRVSNGIDFYRIKVDLLRKWLRYKNGLED